jgi:hypothetical protein
MSYFRSINQAVTVSSGNTDTSNLAVNQIFTGLGESTLGVNSIQVNLKADQNCKIYVEQGPDTSTWNISDQFNYYNGLGGIGFTTQATNAYARVRVKNTGTAPTTSKTLATVFCPIVEALPRALSTEGNLKVGVYEIEGGFNTQVTVTPMNALKITESLRLVGVAISGNTVEPNFWTNSITGSGSVSQSGGEMTLSDGTTASSTVRVQSVRRARYIPAVSNYYRGQVRCPTQAGACNRRWGAYDTTDGYLYQYDGTNISLMSRKNSVDSTVVNGAFNGNYGLSYTLDNSNHTYQTFWTNSNAYFLIDSEVLHTMSATATTLVATPHLTVGMECNNGTGNVTNNSLVLRSATINRLGQAETAPQYSYASTMSANAVNLKNGPGRLHKVVLNQLSGNNGDRLTLYDASGTTNAFSVFATNQVSSIGAIDYHLDFYNGLSYVFNGTGGTPNATFIYE